jgi:3-methyladenine DNA glycosylase/8-oxoguanine DNA glycosylase
VPVAPLLEPPRRVDLRRTARAIFGSTRLEAGGRRLWWATETPDGPGTLRLELDGAGVLRRAAWGPGGDWIAAQADPVVGAFDRPEDFVPPAGLVRDLWRRTPPLVFGRTDRVFDATLEAVLGQKVQATLAYRSLRRLVARHGDPAPGPVDLRMYPGARRVARLTTWEFHSAGVERKRADTIVRAARVAHRLEEAASLGPAETERRLRTIRGIGVWTAALVRTAALGDADAVPVGDFHIPHAVCWALAGEARGSDERMLELLDPYAGHRGRVVALLGQRTVTAPRFGPKLECLPVDHYDRRDTWFRDRSPFGGGYRTRPLTTRR